jgi:hypothetical protein
MHLLQYIIGRIVACDGLPAATVFKAGNPALWVQLKEESDRVEHILETIDKEHRSASGESMQGQVLEEQKAPKGKVSKKDKAVPDHGNWKIPDNILNVLHEQSAIVMEREEKKGVIESIEGGTARFCNTEYAKFPSASYRTEMQPGSKPSELPDELPRKWGYRVGYTMTDEIWSGLSARTGHNLDLRIGLPGPGSGICQSSPEFVVSAADTDWLKSPSPIHKKPAEGFTMWVQVKGRSIWRIYSSDAEPMIRSASYSLSRLSHPTECVHVCQYGCGRVCVCVCERGWMCACLYERERERERERRGERDELPPDI